MKNILYDKSILEDFQNNHEFTLADFIYVCDMLKLPVFEINITINPFDNDSHSRTTKIYNNMSEYRESMPSWSAKHYDYKNDRATYWITIPEIKDGEFELIAENNSSSHKWQFLIAGQCVVVHHLLTIIN